MASRKNTGWRLRHKLGLSLAIAAVLPVLVATWVAVNVTISGLERGIRQDTERQLRVGVNLFVQNIERLGLETVQLSQRRGLALTLKSGRGILATLKRVSDRLPMSVVQVTNAQGVIVAGYRAGGLPFEEEKAGASNGDESITAALGFERRVTVVPLDDGLVVRASAPIVDDSFELLGTVLVSMPVDAAFVANVKAAVGSDVIVYTATEQRHSVTTFTDEGGAMVTPPDFVESVKNKVFTLSQAFSDVPIDGQSYSVGYEPILNIRGELVGIFAVALHRAPVTRARGAAGRSLAVGGLGALLFALGVAALLSRRITEPLQRLHRGAVAISQGDLEQLIIPGDQNDEVGELASAFVQMTDALKENRRRLAARMREIVALHDAGRAVSSVLELEDVLRKIVDAVSKVLHANVCALWLVPSDADADVGNELEIGAARVVSAGMRKVLRGHDARTEIARLTPLAQSVANKRASLRIDDVSTSFSSDELPDALKTGALLGVPVELKGRIVGVILTGRGGQEKPFTISDAHLLSTFADQAGSAVENARQYARERSFNEQLEAKVKSRTNELTAMNTQLANTVKELNDTQTQLILSERLANLGVLVAGVAHEINSPSAAIQGTAHALSKSMTDYEDLSGKVTAIEFLDDGRQRFFATVHRAIQTTSGGEVRSPVKTREQALSFSARLQKRGLHEEDARSIAGELANFNNDEVIFELLGILEEYVPKENCGPAAVVLSGYLMESVFLRRSAATIENAVGRIQRIVLGLKSYSRLDGESDKVDTNLHEGIESTLVLLEHMLSRGVEVRRDFGKLPNVEACADELNQVWTNLIHNAVQAIGGEGEITIQTAIEGDGVVVAVIDNGPGIPEDVLPMVFEPFYTTKKKGEGTGLGLRITKQIVDRHQGRIRVESKPGRTAFLVWIPNSQKPTTQEGAADESDRS